MGGSSPKYATIARRSLAGRVVVAALAATSVLVACSEVQDVSGQGEQMRVQPIQSFEVHPDVEFLGWSADESKIVTSSWFDSILRVWDWRQQNVINKLKKENGGYSVLILGDKVITTLSARGDYLTAFTLWNYRTGVKETVPLPPPAAPQASQEIIVSADGTRLAIFRPTGRFGRVVVYDVTTWRPVGDLWVAGAAAISLSPNGSEVAIANYDGTIDVINVATGTPRVTFQAWSPPTYGLSICWSPNGKFIAAGSYGINGPPAADYSALKIWDPKTGLLLSQLKTNIGDYQVKYLAISPDSAYLVSNQQDGVLHIWDTKTLDPISTISTGGQADFISFSPSGRYLAVSRRDAALVFDWQSLLRDLPR